MIRRELQQPLSTSAASWTRRRSHIRVAVVRGPPFGEYPVLTDVGVWAQRPIRAHAFFSEVSDFSAHLPCAAAPLCACFVAIVSGASRSVPLPGPRSMYSSGSISCATPIWRMAPSIGASGFLFPHPSRDSPHSSNFVFVFAFCVHHAQLPSLSGQGVQRVFAFAARVPRRACLSLSTRGNGRGPGACFTAFLRSPEPRHGPCELAARDIDTVAPTWGMMTSLCARHDTSEVGALPPSIAIHIASTGRVVFRRIALTQAFRFASASEREN